MRREEQQHSDFEEGWRRRRAGGAADWSRDPPLQPSGYSLHEAVEITVGAAVPEELQPGEGPPGQGHP